MGGDENYNSTVRQLKKNSKKLLVVTVLFLVLLEVVKHYASNLPSFINVILHILSGLSVSVIAGLIVTIIADVPSIVSGFKSLIIKSLTSKQYLEALDRDQLNSVKKELIKNLHKEKNLPESLLTLDAKLEDTIDNAYYSYFNETVFCHSKGTFESVYNKMMRYSKTNISSQSHVMKDRGEDFILKSVEYEYEIVNPSVEDGYADIGIKKSLDIPEDIELNKMFLLQEFLISIDDAPVVDLQVQIEANQKNQETNRNPETMTYDSTMWMVVPNLSTSVLTASNIGGYRRKGDVECIKRNNVAPNCIKVQFKERVKVKMRYQQIVSTRDNHYTRRMRYSAKLLSLQYSCEDNVHIHGQVMGTLISQDNVSILQNISKRNMINIQCRDWLLPGNGIFIVLDEK